MVAGSADAPLSAADLEPVLDSLDPRDVVAVVANAGATNTGAVDALDEIVDRLRAAAGSGCTSMPPTVVRPCWRRHAGLFGGIERADSITIDPHKWLFTPFDCAAVLYLDPAVARAAHRQSRDYLEATMAEDADNPADYAVHLTRRARGLPLWASLVANGTDAYVDAVERCLATATYAAKYVEASTELELVTEPQLSVVLFRRRGWRADDYARWSHEAWRSGLALVTPTRFAGETVLRLCFVNPLTSAADVDVVLSISSAERLTCSTPSRPPLVVVQQSS